MKARTRAAAGIGLTLLTTVALASLSSAATRPPSVSYGSRAIRGGVIAGGARIAVVAHYYPADKVVKGRAGEGTCSTGIPWRLANGTRGFLTAGHCVANVGGTQLLRSPLSAARWTTGSPLGGRMGVSVGPTGTLPGKSGDIAFVQAKWLPISNQVFVGGQDTRSRLPITTWTSTGGHGADRLCFSGYTSGTVCGLKVGKVTSHNVGGFQVRGAAEAYQSFGNGCPSSGDSGGAVYRVLKDGRLVAVGVVSGDGHTWGGLGGCSMYYTPLSAAVKLVGGGPILS